MEILVGGESVTGAVNNGDGAGGGRGGSFVVETYDGATNTALPTILAVASGGGGGGKGNGLSGAAKKPGETGSDGVPFNNGGGGGYYGTGGHATDAGFSSGGSAYHDGGFGGRNFIGGGTGGTP